MSLSYKHFNLVNRYNGYNGLCYRRKVISHFLMQGACFENISQFYMYYERLKEKMPVVYVSHIIYQILLDGYRFRPIEVQNYKDWGNMDLFVFFNSIK